MSYKTQVALGKNSTLQRQLEERFIEFRRNLKNTRRHLDTLEEECLSTLYKLVVEQTSKDGDDGGNNVKGVKSASADAKVSDQKRAKSAVAKMWRGQSLVEPPLAVESPAPRRSTTSMAVRDYHKSYSFQVDGMNIDKVRRDRYIRTKKQKQEKEIEIRRGNVHWATKDMEEEESDNSMGLLDMDSPSEPTEKAESEVTSVRPYTADPYQASNNHAKLLQRAKLRNTLKSAGPNISDSSVSSSGNNEGKKVGVDRVDGTGMGPHEDTPTQMAVVDGRRSGRNTPQISFKVPVSKLNDVRGQTPTIPERSETPRLYSRNGRRTTEDDELIPLEEEDRLHLENIMRDTDDRDDFDLTTSRVDLTSRMTSKSGKTSSLTKSPSGKNKKKDIAELTTKTQTFLTSYAKKSKLLGYVVKTSYSSAAPRDKTKKTYRSHCVTYQELVSFKAAIKQQESRTRLLLQRSAKLSSFVADLAAAGNVRRYKQGITPA